MQIACDEMASTTLNSRILEAMVTSRPETSESSPIDGQDVSSAYIAQYTATLEDFARRNGDMLTASPSGEDISTEEDEGSYDDNSSGQKSSISSPLDSAKKRRKQSKPNKIGGCSENGSVGGDDTEKENLEKDQDQVMEVDSGDQVVTDKHSSGSFLHCPHCQTTVDSHDDLRRHIIEEHIGRMLSSEEIILRHAQQAKQKIMEQHNHQQQQHQQHQQLQQQVQHQQQQQQQHQQQYQQRMLAETIRIQEELRGRPRESREQLPQNQHSHSNQSLIQSPLSQNNKSPSRDQQPVIEATQFLEREEGETGPLNLSNSRWGDVRPSSQTQDPQRSPVTPLPASIPMPPSFSDGRLNLPGFLPFGPPPFLLPFMQQSERDNIMNNSGQSSNFGSGQSRVFNIDAFCDLCNKEFCNKYFLKTHKANKHGIFTPEPSCSPMPPTPTTPIGPIVSLNHSTPLMAPLVHSPLTPTSINNSPYTGAFLTANLGNLILRPPLPSQLQAASKIPSNINKNELSPMTKSGGVINLDAYCELCQKEFCNKYFLKRHKLKIHGVNIEVTIKSPKTNPALDRPEGWCDACRRDIGSRSSLNAHKLHVHGPHIVNNITVKTEPSIRHPMDFRQLNSLSLKPNSNDRDQKDNFSPWDMMRERGQVDNSVHWKNFIKQDDINNSFRNDHVSVDNVDRQEKGIAQNINFQNKVNPSVSVRSAILESMNRIDQRNVNEIQKVNAPKVIESENVTEEVLVKLENKNMSDEQEAARNKQDVENDPPMPILKPQTESQRDLQPTVNNIDQGESPPPLTREQSNPQNRMEEDNTTDHGQNNSEPPRTPGGVSNSTDDSSLEAGIIARVGQPAIVQAPPGTKFTPDQLRQLGVINPDAFCELCCKEFCNKYFLRTHRIKKHNIYTPEYSERSKQQFKENTPINLARIFERQALEYRPPSLSDGEMDVECDICRRPFPSQHLLYMHKCYFHGMSPDSIDNMPLREHILPHEHIRQLALQAHEQKMQDHHQLIMRHHKQQQHQQQQIQHQQQQQQQQQLIQQEQNRKQQQQQNELQKQHDNFQDHIKSSISEAETVKNEIESQLETNIEKLIVNSDAGDKDVTREEAVQEIRESTITCKSSHSSPGMTDNANGSEADTSQELRKLQSMILELNRQGDESIHCKVCQKEIGNKYFLRAHMMSEHGILLQDENNSESAHTPKTPFELNGRTTPLGAMPSDSQAYCDICKKDFFSRYILQQHMLSSHGIFTQHPGPTSFLDRIRAEVEGREDRKPQSVSRSFCEICNKELCNKYFMKTHMLKMHGINVENGNSGGVTCDICNKELCSKYFLKVHRQNTHGLIEDIREPKEMKEGIFKERRESDDNPEDPTSIEICPMCQRKFKNIKWLRNHLTQDHGEDGKVKWREIESTLPPLEILTRNIPTCNICGQTQPDVVSLQLHLIKHHSSKLNEDSSNDGNTDETLHCSSCPFMCNNHGLLAAHERSHTPHLALAAQQLNNSIKCQVCSHLLPNAEAYKQHLIGHQLQGLFDPHRLKYDECADGRLGSAIDESPMIFSSNDTREFVGKCIFTSNKRRWRCRRCKLSFKERSSCLVHIFSKHTQKPRNVFMSRQLWRRKKYICTKCGKSERRLGNLIAHIRNKCPLRKNLSLPVARGQPINMDDTEGEFMMQSFLMNIDQTKNGEEECRFVPSLVELPVSEKIDRLLSVSFTLTPT